MKLPLQPFETLKAAGTLPSPKGVALTIMRLCQRDDFSMAQLAAAIKTDPAFVGRLIKAANTVGRQGGGRPVASVEGAMQVLGVSTIRALALGFSLVSNYREGACSSFDYQAFWSQSLVTGLALQALARQVGGCSAEEAFCLGLLSQVGRLAMATVYGARYAPLLEEAGDGDLLRSLERQAFALDHDDLTAALLLDWGFPEILVEPLHLARHAHAGALSENSRSRGLFSLVAIADTIAVAALATGAERTWRAERVYDLARPMGISDGVVGGLLEQVIREWQEWGEMLSIHAANPVRFLPPAQVYGRLQLAVVDPVERQRLREILLRQQYEVLEPGEDSLTQEAMLALMVEQGPRILVTDLAMKGENWEWLRTLRDTRQGREVFVAVVLPSGEDEIAALEAGADEVLPLGMPERNVAARLLAARRVVRMQHELELDREEIRNFASELAVANRRLHEVARTDVLTGFYNRRYAMERFQQEWDGSRRSGRPLACMMIDLDSFKQVNDRYGHDVGDRLLIRVAEVIRANLRATDVTCRIGGDEFLVICPDTEPEALRHCAGRLLDAVRQIRLDTPLGELRASLSIGIAVRQADMPNLDSLLKAADEGMYLAKLSGRDGIGELAG